MARAIRSLQRLLAQETTHQPGAMADGRLRHSSHIVHLAQDVVTFRKRAIERGRLEKAVACVTGVVYADPQHSVSRPTRPGLRFSGAGRAEPEEGGLGGPRRVAQLFFPAHMGSVLVATAGAHRAAILAEEFARERFLPTVAFNVGQVLSFIEISHFDLVTLDLGLAATDRNGLVQSALERSRAAVLTLDDGSEHQPERYLGAYAQSPASAPPSEIVAAGAALLAERMPCNEQSVLCWGPLRLDVRRRLAFWGSRTLELTKLQFRLLSALVMANGGLVTREQLDRLVYGTATVGDGERIVAHVRRVREKIESDPSRPRFLLTVRGEGFRLADMSDVEPLRKAN
jgi:two-component system response regulator RegX3